MPKHAINVGHNTTRIDNGTYGVTRDTAAVIEALIRLVGVEQVLREVKKDE